MATADYRDKVITEFKELLPDTVEPDDNMVRTIADVIETMPKVTTYESYDAESYNENNIGMVSTLATVFNAYSIRKLNENGLFNDAMERTVSKIGRPLQRLHCAMLLPYVLNLDALDTSDDKYVENCFIVEIDEDESHLPMELQLSDDDIILFKELGSTKLKRLYKCIDNLMWLATVNGIGVTGNDCIQFTVALRKATSDCSHYWELPNGTSDDYVSSHFLIMQLMDWFYGFSNHTTWWMAIHDKSRVQWMRAFVNYGRESLSSGDCYTLPYEIWDMSATNKMQDNRYLAKYPPILSTPEES